ncbi:translation initiation factor IF-2 subunit gamma [Candidatus Micrarchaeota archaeon RBG_16_49_10]|nr:MAG: translation initiation factor IF-2 subunit gamma [Candidatus Micrarchaeota archaeon RBG_16_49_10]
MLGHVDHGKTTLTDALTGKWTDTHSEELKRGITIRLGYADVTFYKCKKCGSYTNNEKCIKCFEKADPVRTVSFIDAPGHESLMATVLTGSSIFDGALLLIAANEKCPLPQTREHLTTLQVVGIKNIVVVQNKIDLVDEKRAKESYQEIKAFLKGTIAEDAPIIPVSAQRKVNIDYLIEAIEKHITTPQRDLKKDPLMYIARSFDINRPGSDPTKIVGGILGGSIVQGELKKGDEIEIGPGFRIKTEWKAIRTRIVSLEKAGQKLNKAGAGGLLGLMTYLDPYLTKADGLVGNMVGHPGKLPEVRHKLRVEVHLLERVVGTKEMEAVSNLRMGENLMVNVGTGRSVGTITRLDGKRIEMDLKIPVCADKSDRVVISRQIMGRWRLIGYGTLV